MDTSKEYIEMCRNADDIQKQRGTRFGDFLVMKEGVFVYPDGWSIDSVWLPRQDQLQEMLDDDYWSPFRMITDFANFTVQREGAYSHHITHEQLWLAFVMKEKYDKEWDGSEWVPVRTDNKAIVRDC